MAIVLVVGQRALGRVERVLPQQDASDRRGLTGVLYTTDNPLVATIAPNPTDADPNNFVVVGVNPGVTILRAVDGNNVVGCELCQVGSPSGAYLPRFRVLKTESAAGI